VSWRIWLCFLAFSRRQVAKMRHICLLLCLFICLSVRDSKTTESVSWYFMLKTLNKALKSWLKSKKTNEQLARLSTNVSTRLSDVIWLVFWERKIFRRNFSGKSYVSWLIISTYIVRILSQLDKAVEHIKAVQNLYLFK